MWATLITLDSNTITNHGRKFAEKEDERATEVQLANGRTRKYIKCIAREWTLSWNWLPNDHTTVDGNGGRDTLRGLLNGAQKTMVLYDENGGTSTFNVFLVDYSETLLRRDMANHRSFWDVGFVLKEV